MSDDGWLCSGDVGVVFPNGSIKIIDRAKNIFKLSQGEYIAPEKLENIYAQCPVIAQIFVYGDSLQNFLVGVIVPDMI
jgi:long-chain acyl-CoA synthetase